MTKKELLNDYDFMCASDDAEIKVLSCGFPNEVYGSAQLHRYENNKQVIYLTEKRN